MDRLVVVGASLAGLRAVETARKEGFQGSITLVGAEPHLPYDRPPLSKAFLEAGSGQEPWFRASDQLADRLEVDLRLGNPATALDPDRRAVVVGDEEIPYAAVVLATGAAARSLPGTDGLGGVCSLRTLDDARIVRAALDAQARTVVVGAGFIGSEVASAAHQRGLPVSIVEALDVPLSRSVGDEVGRACSALHESHGVDLHRGVAVTGLEQSDGRVTGVRLSDGSVLAADLVVVGIGVRPSTEWLEDSGVKLHETDAGVVCDETLATGVPGVYAAGDVAHWPNPTFDGELMRLEHWTTAAEQAAVAVRNALDPTGATPMSTVPYFWSDWYEHRLQFVGIPRADEVQVVHDGLPGEGFVALYRRDDRLVGTMTVDRPAQIMKYRRLISERAGWEQALAFAASRTR